MLIWQILTLLILLALSGFFSGIEVALVSIRDLKLKHFLRTGRTGADELKKLKSNPRRMIITILIGNNIVNISASVLASVMATSFLGSKGAGIAIGVMTFLILVFGEIMPKSYASTHFESISLFVAKPLIIFQKVIFPLVLFFEWFPNLLLRITGEDTTATKSLTEKELKTAFEVGAEESIIKKSEEKLLKNVLEFDDIPAWEVMTPRDEIISLNADLTIEKSLKYFEDCPYSRVPLYRENKANIVGVVHVKELLEAVIEGEAKRKLIDIAYKPFSVSDEIIIADLFKVFQQKHIHFAIVKDENNEIVGLITIEDLLEEIVGEIIDESDVTPDQIMRIDRDTILVDGETPPAYIKSFFNINLPSGYRTISDYLKERTEGKFYRGQELKIEGNTFTIEEVGEDYIERVVIRKG